MNLIKKYLFKKKSGKFMKGFIAIFLVVVLCFISVGSVSAQSQTRGNTVFAATLEIVSYPNNIFSSSAGSVSGHSFLIVRNYNSYAITVGHMRVPSNTAITIGLFGNRSAHQGVWYNIEGYWASSINSSLFIAKLQTSLTETDLTILNSYINDYDYYNISSNNCTIFCVRCWNAVSSTTVSGSIPSALYNNIRTKSGYSTNINVPIKNINDIAYQTSSSVKYDTSGADN